MSLAGNSIGIDYHTKSIQVQVMDGLGAVLGTKRCSNDVVEVAEYVSRYGEVGSIAVKACTGSSAFADELHGVSGWEVKLCHPGYVQRMRHNPDKTDKSDAYLLSDLNRVGYLPLVWLAPEALRDLRTLVRYRKQLVEQRKEVKLRVRSILRQYRVKTPGEFKGLWTKRGLRWLKQLDCLPVHTKWVMGRHLGDLERLTESITEVDAQLSEAAKDDRLVQALTKIRGVGFYSAVVIRAEIGTFTRFRTGKQLARFCGVSPRNCSSAERQADSGMIKAGNALLKTVIVETAHTLMRHSPDWNAFAARLKASGKPYCLIVGAVANRWIRRFYHEALLVECSQS